MKLRIRRSAALLALLTAAACGPPARPAPPPTPAAGGPFSVVLFVADGAGLAYWTAAKLATSDLAIDRFPTIGLMTTQSADSRVTDSAAGATAFSTGQRTYNGGIAVSTDTTPLPTVLEVAQKNGMGTGVVVTATVTHATPAAFLAHVASRNEHWEIAAQIAKLAPTVLLGGGRQYFDPTRRADQLDLLAAFRGRSVFVDSPETFAALDPDTIRSLVGLFSENNPGTATERKPSLPEMTGSALRVLSHQDRGFFLLVEGSQIDWRGHENAPLQEVIAEVLDLDLSIRRALAYQEEHPNTLIVVLADHNTGGLALHADPMGTFGAHYTTTGHTASLVPLFARGPGAAAFGGVVDNDRVGQLLLGVVARGGAAPVAPESSTRTTRPWNRSSH